MSTNGTVEASFIIPIILVIIMSFLYVLFAVHDRGVIHIMTDLCMEELCVNSNSEEVRCLRNIESGELQNINCIIKDRINAELMVYKVKNVELTEKKTTFKIQVDAGMKVSLPIVDKLVSDLKTYTYKHKQSKNNYCTDIRKLEIGKN